ncbi:MAG: site-specific DNA-methyltransferase [Elusimicrobia bacterium]|nr:site-specific DNA-methyltransferase [Candidatus Liberimonas magnetica]
MPTIEWSNKDKAILAANKVPFRLLDEDKEHSYGNKDASNMLIQGDNLDALKSLLPVFAGKIKCVYIDPPYNTGNAFKHYDDGLEHSLWLSMMQPRIELLHRLLDNEQGTLWISIDDEEGHYLKVLCDEVFGRNNFVANVIWEKKFSPQNDAKWLSDSHDHIFVYAKNKEEWRPNLLPRTDDMDARYKNPDNDPRGIWTSGDVSVKTYSAATDYTIVTPSGRKVNPPSGYCWRLSKDKLQEMIADNRIWFGEKGNNVPRIKRFLSEVKEGSVSKTIWYRTEVGDNQEAKKEMKVFNIDEVFSTPKPERLIQRIFTLASKESDWVLDSFLGSGTAAAVAHKMKRNWIGVEMGEHAVTHCVPRLKKVIDGEEGGISEIENWKGGGGFRFFKLGAPVFNSDGTINPDVRFKTLASHIWFYETKTPAGSIKNSPFLGSYKGTGYYLLYNGILGDKKPEGGNVLTRNILRELPKYDGPKVIYGEISTLSKDYLKRLNIVFKQIPYDVRSY